MSEQEQRTPDFMTIRKDGRCRRVTHPNYDQIWMAQTRARCVVDEKGCWIWQGFVHPNGYGSTSYRNKGDKVHRAMYRAFHGAKITSKQYVCHRCDAPACCNPDHLFLGTQFDNMADSVRKGRHAEQLVTHCPRGHAYDEINTGYHPNGARTCRACCRGRQRVKSGWPEEEAYSTPPIPQNAPTERRRFGKRKVA